VAAAVALAAGPASYSVASLSRSLNGNNVIAGPATSTGGMGGAMPGAGGDGGGGGGAPSTRGGGGDGGGGGELSSEVIAYLEANQGSAKYLLAASGSQTTASIIIATGEPVVTIGGFGGNDPAPTVAQLAAMVANGELKYVLVSSGSGGGPGATSDALTTWVKAHGTAVKAVSVSSGTLYKVSA